MFYREYIKIKSLVVHSVGNKLHQEDVRLSKRPLSVDAEVKQFLTAYFVSAFKSPEYFTFLPDSESTRNRVFACARRIFDDPETLLDQSVVLARHLYDRSEHPKIKGGEFYTVYFQECIIDGETVDAVGLFKSENKDTFLKIYPAGESFEIESETGINIHKLDKGCLIFNTEQDKGYVVAVVDNTGKGTDAQYWMDDFLHVGPRHDDYYHTQQALSLCGRFVREELPQQFDMSKADQAALLNKSVQFFKDRDTFNVNEFAAEVMEQPDLAERFGKYKSDYQRERDIEIADDFAISDSAVKKQARVLRSVIKLDKNFHIYVHGNRNLIEQGVDENGKFYKIYYREES
ncbi:MAG: nucleoid-associated protein [Prevotellaceae bacterium]|jgi:hypothetical protein|nr:nucleoid-associated protein [Prevotellaceae bacterium]